MKKLFILIIGTVMMATLAGSSVMAIDMEAYYLKGVITSIDTNENTVTIQETNGTIKTVTVEATLIAPLKGGETVKVMMMPDGKTAEKFEIIKDKNK